MLAYDDGRSNVVKNRSVLNEEVIESVAETDLSVIIDHQMKVLEHLAEKNKKGKYNY